MTFGTVLIYAGLQFQSYFLFLGLFFFTGAFAGMCVVGTPSATTRAALYGSRKLTGLTDPWRNLRFSISTKTEKPMAK